MGKALYRKYRSKSLDEIVGQAHITKTLANALKTGRISHAYLFTGPRGVGKTSVARILAHAVNKLPYNEERDHMDIIEIDAASNRRIEEIRDLRDKVHITPTSATYKVYIIDEVHMLTREAFNALLKTLEEPPGHAIFILATTEAHKLPETIISRTQRFTFRPIDPSEVVAHLRFIADKEKIAVSDEALNLIAEHGDGSFRDSISLLDQASNLGGKVSLEDVQRLLGIAPGPAIERLRQAVTKGTPKEIVSELGRLKDQGFQAAGIANQLAAALRQGLLDDRSALPPYVTLRLLNQLLEVPAALNPESFLELALIEPGLERNFNAVSDTPGAVTDKPVAKPDTAVSPQQAEQVPSMAKPAKPAKQALNLDTAWPLILKNLRQQHNTLYTVARMAQPMLADNDTLILKFAFQFHQKRIKEARNQKLLLDIITETTGRHLTLDAQVDKNARPPDELTDARMAPGPVDTISNIFGGAELLD